jgi:hypothetical protein
MAKGALFDVVDLQGSRPLEWSVPQRAKRVSTVTWDTHRKSRERGDAGALVIRCHERCSIISNRENSIWIIDPYCWTIQNLDASVLIVERFDEATGKAFEELVSNNLRNLVNAVDGIAENLSFHEDQLI